jgi:hypothetical protein
MSRGDEDETVAGKLINGIDMFAQNTLYCTRRERRHVISTCQDCGVSLGDERIAQCVFLRLDVGVFFAA